MAKTKYNPYCELCDSCGEDGCCSHVSCFSALIKNPKCKYGSTYVKDAILNRDTVQLAFELIEKFKTDENYSKDDFLKDFDEKYDQLLDERFK